MTAVKRLPTHPHHRALALVRDSMPRRDYREYPEAAARVMRESAQQRAACYAALEEVTDEAARVSELLDSDDGIVVDLTDEIDARSVRHRLAAVREAAAALVDDES